MSVSSACAAGDLETPIGRDDADSPIMRYDDCEGSPFGQRRIAFQRVSERDRASSTHEVGTERADVGVLDIGVRHRTEDSRSLLAHLLHHESQRIAGGQPPDTLAGSVVLEHVLRGEGRPWR